MTEKIKNDLDLKTRHLDKIKCFSYVCMLGVLIVLVSGCAGLNLKTDQWYGNRPNYLTGTLISQIVLSTLILFILGVVINKLGDIKNYEILLKSSEKVDADELKNYWERYFHNFSFSLLIFGIALIIITLISGINLLFMRDCENITQKRCIDQINYFYNKDFLRDSNFIKENFCINTSCQCKFTNLNYPYDQYTHNVNGIQSSDQCDTILSQIQKKNWEIIKKMEDNYFCSGFCIQNLIYQARNVNDGIPQLTCSKKLCYLANNYYWYSTVAPGWQGAIMILASILITIYKNKLLQQDDEDTLIYLRNKINYHAKKQFIKQEKYKFDDGSVEQQYSLNQQRSQQQFSNVPQQTENQIDNQEINTDLKQQQQFKDVVIETVIIDHLNNQNIQQQNQINSLRRTNTNKTKII